MHVKRVAFLNDQNELVGEISGDAAEILVNLIHPDENANISFSFCLDKGMYSKPLPILTEIGKKFVLDQQSQPTNISGERSFKKIASGYYFGCYMFKSHFFEVSLEQSDEEHENRAILLIKKYVYAEDGRWKKLEGEIQLMENVLSLNGAYKRRAIPEAVKLFVFSRDAGKCVRCGSQHTLHFDHMIPVSRGGGNSAENIQILCEQCNLRKSDKIAF